MIDEVAVDRIDLQVPRGSFFGQSAADRRLHRRDQRPAEVRPPEFRAGPLTRY